MSPLLLSYSPSFTLILPPHLVWQLSMFSLELVHHFHSHSPTPSSVAAINVFP